jgi:hypothetical protein
MNQVDVDLTKASDTGINDVEMLDMQYVKNRDIFENKCIMDKITMDFQKQRFLDLS